jgi:hypothetical protein
MTCYRTIGRSGDPLAQAGAGPRKKSSRLTKREFATFGWDGSVTLANFSKNTNQQSLLSRLYKVAMMKLTKQDFPIMPVSKFLYFYNPALFPIYDEKVIWGVVLEKRFNRDFRIFHEVKRLDYKKGYSLGGLRITWHTQVGCSPRRTPGSWKCLRSGWDRSPNVVA